MYGAGFHLDSVEGVPQEMQRKAANVSLELEQHELEQSEALISNIQRLSTEYLRELRTIVGEENLERYFAFRAPLRQQVRDVILKAEPTAAGEVEIQEARREAADKSRRFLKEIGFDMPRASKLRGEYHTRVLKLISEAIDRPEEPNFLVLPDRVPKNIYNPWEIFQPPYPGWAWAWWKNKSDEPYWPSGARYLDSAAGQLGTYTHTHVDGADDSDWAYIGYRTAMRFWYRLPVAGMAEVWMDMQCINTHYSGWLDDEWGWSDSACDQESHAYVRVIAPGPGAYRWGTILDYRRTGTDANWSRDLAAAGANRWAHIFSADAYPGGTWLLLEVGTREWNYFWSNDVSICSAMTMRWFLDRVFVRSSGE